MLVCDPRVEAELVSALQDRWLVPGQLVLDLGCGQGSELEYLAEHGLFAVGIDVSAHALQHARERRGVRFLQGDVLHLPFASNSFDALLDRGCFEYVPPAARTAYAEEAARVLRPGGHLLMRACVDEPALRRWFSGWDMPRFAAHPRDRQTLIAYLEHPAA